MAEPSEHFFDAPLLSNPEEETHRIHYLTWGDAGKPALMCVHGLTRNAHDFDYIARALSEHYHVICPSMAGRGESEYLSDTTNYNYIAYMSDCLALLDHLGIAQCDWVGTSMGALIGMMTAALSPARIGKLVMNDIGFIVPQKALAFICDYAANPPVFDDKDKAIAYMKDIQAGFGITEQAHWDHFLRYSLIEENGRYRLNYDRNILEPVRTETNDFKEIKDINLTELWQPVRCPILLLRGEYSEVLPVEVAAMMRQDKALLDFAEIPHCGHAPHLMSEEQIQLVQEWLLKD